MVKRLYNFNPGPAALPLEVLEQAQKELVEYREAGLSLMEMSHRSRQVEELNEETQALLLELLGLEKGYRALFMGGGASTQFALVPLNLLAPGTAGSYALTGSFAEKACNEAAYVGETHIAASSKDAGWRSVPQASGIRPAANAAYLHITTNNTIEGSRYNELPETGDIPLIADMTSDLLSRRMDFRKFALIYAGAQKNLGPAGVTAVIIREDLLPRLSKSIPLILRYETFVKDKSLYNTPPVHTIYMMNLVLKWTLRQGGLERLEQLNADKANLLYRVIDASAGFYKGIIDVPDRSHMNVTWRMADGELERLFVKESERHGFEGLAGHRSVGGLRASVYNAVPAEACRALADFMADFQRRHG
ncbi:3-phosphoserine/phosphohydroxythreonine transaminase [Paenibacillus hamazuiensis]|uniref:3-phosphoserine/phosphohydroxythreonine transaminase n=1 Tax=Paenibacillus hamazuiensis TaxID=2936508 RepID=UPI00200DB03C|nr:3-phosphoserine/phosphohydroxythreonine transaminase [Paenibacillus hamazuiensis]